MTSGLNDSAIRDLGTKPPNGVVVVRMIGARKLGHQHWYTNFTSVLGGHLPPNMCNHYVKIKLGEQERITSSVQYTTNPIYDETFMLIVHSRDSHRLEFSVMATGMIAGNSVVGNASISLQSLQPHRLAIQTVPLEYETNTFDVMDRPGACVDFHCLWKPVLPKQTSTTSGILIVELIAAHNLTGVNTLGGKSDPYMKFNVVGNAEKYSTVKPNTLEPVWEPPERFEFVVCNSDACKLNFELLDQDNVLLETSRMLTFQKKAKSLGHASMDIANVACMLDPLDQTFDLIDGQGRVELRLWWYSTGDGIVLT